MLRRPTAQPLSDGAASYHEEPAATIELILEGGNSMRRARDPLLGVQSRPRGSGIRRMSVEWSTSIPVAVSRFAIRLCEIPLAAMDSARSMGHP
jgi:hypothetical protein